MMKWLVLAYESDLCLKLSAALTGIGLMVIIYWLWVQNPQLTDVRESRIIQTGPFHAGDSFTIERTYCDKFEDGYAVRYMIGDVEGRTDVYHVDEGELYRNTKCPVTARRWVTIPKEAAPGQYTYRVVVSFPINPLKRGVGQLPDLAFEVVK